MYVLPLVLFAVLCGAAQGIGFANESWVAMVLGTIGIVCALAFADALETGR